MSILPLVLRFDGAARLEIEQPSRSLVNFSENADAARLTGGLHARRDVHRVAPDGDRPCRGSPVRCECRCERSSAAVETTRGGD